MGVSDRSCRSVRVQECSRITKSQQKRRSAFACIEACRDGAQKGPMCCTSVQGLRS